MATRGPRRPTETRGASLRTLCEGTPGISRVHGADLAEAAVVCLEEQRHQSGVTLSVDGDFNEHIRLSWESPEDPEQARRTWGDPEEATEKGACGVAALLIETLTDLTVIERSRKGTGFDYWLGPKNGGEELFQNRSRLEVSGIRVGDGAAVAARVRQKIKQVHKGGQTIPGFVAVVEFGAPKSSLVSR